MFQRDYILRMIEQLSLVMARYLRLKAQEQERETLLTLEEFYGKLMLPSGPLLLKMPDQDLKDLLSVNGEPDLDKTVGLALIFKEEGRVFENMNRYEDSSERFNKALFLMLTSLARGAHIPGLDGPQVVEELRELLRTYRIPAGTLVMLAAYYTGLSLYGKAEDAWFELLDAPGAAPRYLEEARGFYTCLLELPDEELERGGLPREEVDQGKRDLERLFRTDPLLPK